jgi:hypothetical protein
MNDSELLHDTPEKLHQELKQTDYIDDESHLHLQNYITIGASFTN